MLRPLLFALLLLALPLAACDSDENAARASVDATAAASAPGATPPFPGAPSLTRLDTFAPVYEVFVDGRIPGGLLNEVTISKAGADMYGFYIGEDSPQDLYLDLSIVAAAPRREFIDATGHAYEWWFSSRDQTDEYTLHIYDAKPELKVAIRHAAGAWGVYIDEGAGWAPLEGAFRFGVSEASATVRIDESWRALSQTRDAYVRTLVRHEEPTEDGFQVGDVFPRDGSWFLVSR